MATRVSGQRPRPVPPPAPPRPWRLARPGAPLRAALMALGLAGGAMAALPATAQGFFGFGQPRPADPGAPLAAPLPLIPQPPIPQPSIQDPEAAAPVGLAPLDGVPLPLPGGLGPTDAAAGPDAPIGALPTETNTTGGITTGGITTEVLAPPPPPAGPVAPAVIPATEAHVRWLDKLTGRTADLWLAPGTALRRDHLLIRMDECRVPEAAPASDAFAYLVILDTRADQSLFAGWMIASSPALSAMDHPRYDVWLMGCATAAGSGQ